MAERPTVGDLLDAKDGVGQAIVCRLEADIARIDAEYDRREYAYRAQHGMLIPRALWRRLKEAGAR